MGTVLLTETTRTKAMSTSDIATITVLCELATADRDRIHRVLLDRASLRASVDDNQGWILDLIHSFMGAQYDKVSDILRTVEVGRHHLDTMVKDR